MKKTFFILLAFSAITLSASAQQRDFTQDSSGHHSFHQQFHQQYRGGGDMGMQGLNLTADQQAALKANNQLFRKQMDSLHKNEDITVRQSRDQEYALRQQHKAYFESILTSEQKATLKEHRNDRMAQRDFMMSKRLDRMQTKLGLTDEQVAQIKAQHDAIREKRIAIRENNNLTREERQAQLAAIRSESKDGFKKILTADQLEKLEQFKKARMEKNNS